jgi:proteic killer suppression protein
LAQCAESYSVALRTWGNEIARKYQQRVKLLENAESIAELRQMPGLRCHPLKGERSGEWAINLNRYYRLIFTLEGRAAEMLTIEEVSKHYGD